MRRPSRTVITVVFLSILVIPFFLATVEALPNENLVSPSQQTEGLWNVGTSSQLTETPNSLGLKEYRERVSHLVGDSIDVVVVYDSTDNTTTTSAGAFRSILEYESEVALVPIQSFVELDTVLSCVTADQVVITVVHGITDSFMIDGGYISWFLLDESIRRSAANRHILASCFSATLDANEDNLRIKGLESILDYEIAVPLLSLYALEFLYERDGIDRSASGYLIQQYFIEKQDRIACLILSPENVLGTKMTVHYRSGFMDRIHDLIDVITAYLKSEFKNMARSVVGAIFSMIPEGLFDCQDLLNTTLDGIGDIDLSLIDTLLGAVTSLIDGVGKEKEFKRKVNDHLSVKVTFFLKLQIDKNLGATTDYQIASTYIQFGFAFEFEFWTPFQLGFVPLNVTLNGGVFYHNEILLEYMGHDPDWVSTEEQKINPTMFRVPEGADSNDATKANSFLAYANVKGPYGDVPIEAWWGSPTVDIPLPFRSYGGFSLTLSVKLRLAHEDVLKKIGHTDDAIGKAIKRVCDAFREKCTFGQAAIHGYFTLAAEGIKITLLGSLWVGIDIEIEVKICDCLKAGLRGYVRFENLIISELTWDLSGIYLSQAKIYWPRISFALVIKIEIKLPVDWLPSIKIDVDLAKSLGLTKYYLPTGPKTDKSEDFGNVFLRGEWTYDSSPLRMKCPVNKAVMGVIGAIGTTLPVEQVIALLGGTIDVINGTPADTTPPQIFFVTPAYVGDPVSNWPDIPDPYDPESLMVQLIAGGTTEVYFTNLTETGIENLLESVDITNTTLDRDSMLDGSSAVMLVSYKDRIPLRGDNATIRLYTFDEHDADNSGSSIKRVTVSASFDKTQKQVNYGLGEYMYGLYSEYIFEPLSEAAEIRLMYSLDIYERIVLFYDDQGRLFDWTATTFRTDQPLKTTAFTKWVESRYIRVVIEPLLHVGDDNLDETSSDVSSGTVFPYSRLYLLAGEVQFFADWDSNITAGDGPYTNLVDGGLFLDESTVETDGLGDGPITETRGWEAYWNLKIPLHKFYRDGVIEPGFATFTVTAWDTADLCTTESYSYYVDVSPDTKAPCVTRVSANTRDVTEYDQPSLHIAAGGVQYYDFDVVEVQEYVSYQFDFGSGTSTRGVHTGIPHQWSDQVQLVKTNPRSLITQGSGTDNGYSIEVHRDITNEESSYFIADIQIAGDFSLHLFIQSDVGVTEIVYDSTNTASSPCQDGSRIVMPTCHMQLNDGNWHVFLVDLQIALRTLFPEGTVLRLASFQIRGNAAIDNLRLDDDSLYDADVNGVTGWVISDAAPAGATISVERTSRLEGVDAQFDTSAVEGTSVYDSEGIRVSQRFRLTLDTTVLPDGYYVLSFTAYDVAGYCDTSSVWIVIDNDAPTAPENVQFTPSSTTNPDYGYDYIINWDSADDVVGVWCYMVYLNGVHRTSTTGTSATIRVLSDTAFLGTWEIIAEDYSDRTTTTAIVFSVLPDYDKDGLNDFREWDYYATNPLKSDSDVDGMPDGWEVTYGLNPLSAADASNDKDGDGLSNYAEYEHGTLPTVTDSDSDGMRDGWEVQYAFNPKSAADASIDSDADGRTNVQEYATGTNPRDPDSDDDSLYDGEEASLGTNPLNSDTDSDSLSDPAELNTYDTSPTDSDSDDDGLSDGSEVLVYGTYPLDSDSDDDGMPDGWEVSKGISPLVSNAGSDADADGLTNLQEYQMGLLPCDSDYDNDGLSDGVEVAIGTNPKSSDSDSDGLSDENEVNHFGTSPLDRDTDDDSLSDFAELELYGTNPLKKDTDYDGLSDYFELFKSITNPLKSDTDGDGYTDGVEWYAGTNPNSSASYPGSTTPIIPIDKPDLLSSTTTTTGTLDTTLLE